MQDFISMSKKQIQFKFTPKEKQKEIKKTIHYRYDIQEIAKG